MKLFSTRIRNHNNSVLLRLDSILAVALLFFPLYSVALQTTDPLDYPTTTNPLIHTQLQIVNKESLALACNPHHRIASWVTFELTEEDLDRKPRYNRFSGNYPSESLMTGPCVVYHNEFKDYTAAGYDRGHLADSESFTGSVASNTEVATTANLTPQDKAFNRGIWAKLEAWQRRQAVLEQDIVIYVGPVLNNQLSALSPGITIPEKFYKIIIDKTPPLKVIAFIISQEDRGNFKNHWLCADEVERQTGLSFADHLLGAEKSHLFKNCDINDWQ
jgi:endonuclease G, mitochondrial